jgi:hypothetical protein
VSDGCYCEWGGGEDAEFCTVSTVTARVQHKCCECRDVIRPGERYERTAGRWDGRMATFKTCDYCARLRERLAHMTDEPPAFGELGCVAYSFPEIEPAVQEPRG